MNKKLLPLSLGFIIIILLNCCEEKTESDILLFVEPDKDYIKITKQERIDFTIKCQSTHEIKDFKIGTKTTEFSTNYFLDSTINRKSFEITYPFHIPQKYDKNEITVLFSVKDANSKEKKLAKKVIINKEEVLLSETTGHTFYSHLSEEADGYNLLENEPVFTTYDDSSDIHVYDASEDSLHGDNLSRRWETMADVKFVKYNDFDYANATNLTIEEAYQSGVKKEFVTDIQSDDIIISKINDKSPVAVKIVTVFDPDSTHKDRYIFNLKKEE